jgi:hypothetical protein
MIRAHQSGAPLSCSLQADHVHALSLPDSKGLPLANALAYLASLLVTVEIFIYNIDANNLGRFTIS